MLQSERYQEVAIAAHTENEALWTFLVLIRDEIKSTHIEMKQIDNRGIFEKDDHVGFIFTGLLDLSTRLYHFITDRVDIADDTDKEEK